MNSPPANTVTRGRRRYLIELSIAMAIYVVTIGIRGWLLRSPLLGSELMWLRLVVALCPLVPVLLMVAAIIRCLGLMDEMIRRIQIESLAIAGAITALMAVTYGFLEGPNFPLLSAWWTYGVFMGSWLVISIFLRWRYCS